jgi:hypothetical protein
MTVPPYPFLVSENQLTFAFESVSPERVIIKQVLYDQINDIYYNLALVDVMPDGRLADDVVSDNQDLPKVIATVLQTMFVFFDEYPDKLIYFQGSDAVRTRFYRIIIDRELNKVRELFLIYGRKPDNSLEEFISNSVYVGFVFALKS